MHIMFLHVDNIPNIIIIVFCVICFVFETGPHCAALNGLELVDQAGPKLRYPLAFVFPFLGLEACTNTTSLSLHFIIKWIIDV